MTVEQAVSDIKTWAQSFVEKTRPVPDELVGALCNALYETRGVNPSATFLVELIGSVSPVALKPGLRVWKKAKGLPTYERSGRHAKRISVQDLQAKLTRVIAYAPQTGFDSRNDGRWPVPSGRILSILYRTRVAG